MPDTRLVLPPLYAILDIDSLLRPGAVVFEDSAKPVTPPADPDAELLALVLRFAAELHAGGVRLLQYRFKQLPVRTALAHALALRQRFCTPASAKSALAGDTGSGMQLIMNDRADLCLAAGFDGVHVGHEDLAPEAVRQLVGERIIGASTHNPEQLREADQGPADYVAIGPVFPTTSKSKTSPLVGLEGVRQARKLTSKPLVAISGITLENCRQVREAGADSVAIIAALLRHPRRAAEEFLQALA